MNVSPPSAQVSARPAHSQALDFAPAFLWIASLLGAVIAGGPAVAGPRATVLQDTVYRSVSEFGPDTLLIRELVFGAPILTAQVNESNGDLVIALRDRVTSGRGLTEETRELAWLLGYDAQAHRVKWEKSSELLPITAQGNRVLLSKDRRRSSLSRIEDGQELVSIHGMPLVWSDRVALRVTEGEVYRWDLESGFDLWRTEREAQGPLDTVIRRDSVAYVVANGIQKIDLRDGTLWSYSAAASRKGLYSAGDGETVQIRSLYGGSEATSLIARPLIREPDIWFAADTTVVRLDSGTGAVRWSRNLTRPRGFSIKQRALGTGGAPQFLGRLLLRDAGQNLLVASVGWASGPKHGLVADPPTVALLAKSDGRVVARVQVPGVTFLNDARSTPFGHYVVSSDRVLALDDSLRVRASWEAPVAHQPLGQFIDVGDALVLTTGPGIAALSSDSLQIVWSRRCGRMLEIDRGADESGARYCVTTQGLIRLDRDAGLRPNAYYPLRSSWAELREGWLLMGAGTRLRIVTLLRRRPAAQVD